MQRTTKNPEVRRQEIILTAIRLFIEKGYDQTSMLDIAKSIHVSQGLCYRYFKSKEEIYQTALDAYVSQGVDCFLSMFGDESQPIIETILSMEPLCNKQDESSIYHNFFNLPGNSYFHIQMELALINRLIPIVAKRLDSANAKEELNIDDSKSVAAYILYGQLGIWQLEGIKNEIRTEHIRNYTKKLLGV